MKKKFIGSLLLASLTLASTSTFVSCKDYDDDINDVNKRVDDLAAMKTTLATVEQTVKDLSAQLEDAKAKATAAVGEEQTRAKAAEAALAARLETLEAARTELQNLIDQKVDKSEFNEKIQDVYAKLESVQTDLGNALTSIDTLKDGLKNEEIARKAAIEDLQQQINALNKIGDPTKIVADLEALKENIGTVKIAELKKMLEEASNKVNDALAEINNLNVLIKQALRGLVFVPQSYYWGIEAQEILTLKYDSYSLPETDYSKSEVEKGHVRYTSTAKEKVLDFVAKYHMNPSSANVADFKDVKVLSDDKAYTRTAEAGLYAESYAPDNLGGLDVTIRMKDASKVKTVADNSMVTVFATQVTLGTGDRDTTITSDYATLYKSTISDLKLAHRSANDVPFYLDENGNIVKNTHCGACGLNPNTSADHLMQTASEAAVDFEAQDYCVYNEDLDLRKLVETHYITATGEEKVFDPARYGMTYKFELTGYYVGGETTSESAHAAIAPDGYTFHPQKVTADGKQDAYPGQRDRTTIGRTPLVRVSLVDVNGNEVYDYGYIRIMIVDAAPVDKADEFVSYATGTYKYSGECHRPNFSFANTWAQTEHDIYTLVGCTREEFETYYRSDDDAQGTANQYYVKSGSLDDKTAKFAPVDVANPAYGVIVHSPSQSGSIYTNTVSWTMTGANALTYFTAVKNSGLTGTALNNKFARAMKFVSSRKDKYPDVWVVFLPADVDIVYPTAKMNFTDAMKNPKYWYVDNAKSATDFGFAEIHNNVPTPEESTTGRGDVMKQMFSKVFMGNNIKATDILTISNDRSGEYAANKLTLSLIFANANVGKSYVGESGATYTLGVENNGKTLYATLNGTKQTVATISNDADVNKQTIEYAKTSYSEDLLNYKAHNELANDVIKAFVTVTAKNSCSEEQFLTFENEDYFTVRFLRPINVAGVEKNMVDAAVGTTNKIFLKDIVTFTDWRDAWLTGYDTYYGISNIEIIDVASGATLADNSNVLTNQSGTETKLKDVNAQLDMVYMPDANDYKNSYILYKNFGSTVQSFYVKVPVKVTYYWGSITVKDIKINIANTVNNSKRH